MSRKKKNWKADEMEMMINYKAARNAFVFLDLALFVYCVVYYLQQKDLPFVFLIFSLSGILFNGTKIWETRRLTRTEEQDEE